MRILGKLADIGASIALFLLVVMTICGVFMRYFVNQPLQWTEEISGLLMIWVVMLGGIVAERDKAHLSIPFVVASLPKVLRITINTIVSVISIGLLLYMAYLGYNLAQMAEFKLTQILKISWYWIDLAVPVGAIGIALFSLCALVKYFIGTNNSNEEQL